MGYEDLKILGLNRQQSQVLYQLIRLGEAKASSLAKSCEIDRVRVYDILEELYSMGFIRKIKSRPTKYVSLEPKKIFDNALDYNKRFFEKKKEELAKNKRKVEEELSHVFNRSDKKKPKNILELLSIGDVSENETRKLIEDSKKTVRIMTEALQYVGSLEEALKKTNSDIMVIFQNRGLSSRAKKSQKIAVEKLKKAGAQIRYYEKMPLRGCISDDKKAIINIQDKKSSNLLRDCIFTNHKAFVEAMNIYFDNMWEKSSR